jgi:hypothetical protein
MERLDFKKGDVFIEQGAPQAKALFIADGTIKRERVVNDQSHQVRGGEGRGEERRGEEGEERRGEEK